MKRKALGKGLGALIPDRGKLPEDRVQKIPVGQIKPAIQQPRQFFSTEALKELADSIRENGVIQPVVLRPVPSGFELIAGERRLRASKMAGLSHIPAIIKNTDDETALALALIENLQREDLNPIEAAAGYRLLADQYGLTQEEIAKKVGKDRATITNTLRLLKLPEEIHFMIEQGDLSAGHAKALLAIASQPQILKLAKACASNRWSVRELERRVKALNCPHKKIPESTDPIMDSALNVIRQRFATKVSYKPRKKGGGSIILEYYSDDDLTRILELLDGE